MISSHRIVLLAITFSILPIAGTAAQNDSIYDAFWTAYHQHDWRLAMQDAELCLSKGSLVEINRKILYYDLVSTAIYYDSIKYDVSRIEEILNKKVGQEIYLEEYVSTTKKSDKSMGLDMKTLNAHRFGRIDLSDTSEVSKALVDIRCEITRPFQLEDVDGLPDDIIGVVSHISLRHQTSGGLIVEIDVKDALLQLDDTL